MKKAAEYSKEFKQSIVNLYRSGKASGEIQKEHGKASSCFYKWVKNTRWYR